VQNNPLRYTDPTGHWYYEPGCDCLVDTKTPGNEYPENLLFQPIRNEFDFTNINVWTEPNPGLSIKTQDVATTISTSGAIIEAGATLGGCVTSPGPGCVAGWSLGNGFYQVVMNPIESAFSYFSTFLSITYDLSIGNTRLEGDVLVIGESSTTSLATSTVGNYVPIGVVDAAIDNYASAYNHGRLPGVFDILGIKGKTIDLGIVKIRFGDIP
jgi:hypothetical protein